MNARLEELAGIIEAQLRESVKRGNCAGVPERLREIIEYALLGGGKRIRPVLCLASCEAAGGDISDAMPAALAIEVLHNYTLVHDDMPCMDNDDIRRGRPTVHRKYGFAEAALAGDAMQAFAFELAAETEIDPARAMRIMRALARAAGPAGVVGGQWEDVTSRPPHNAAQIDYVHDHKTADLIRCAAEMGAIAGGADDAQFEAISRYARSMGVAFQIIDDILDYNGAGGKVADNLSCLEVLSVEQARARAAKLTADAMSALDSLRGDSANLRDLASALLIRRY